MTPAVVGFPRWMIWVVGLPVAFWGLWLFLASQNTTYMSERMLWPAEVEAKRVALDPAAVPSMVVENVVERLRRVITTYPKTMAAARAQLLIGSVYSARKQYDQARQELERVATDYPTRDVQIFSARNTIAHTYQQEQQWDKALDAYRQLLIQYPQNPRVLDIPFRMYTLARQHAADAGDAVLQEGIEFYRRLIAEAKRPELVFLARQRLANCYALAAHWEEAVKEFEGMLMTYPHRPETRIWLHAINRISTARLNDPKRAERVAARYVERYPARRRLVESWLKPRQSARVPASEPGK